MAGSKKQQKTEEVYTPVIPVVSCADETQVDRIVELSHNPHSFNLQQIMFCKGMRTRRSEGRPHSSYNSKSHKYQLAVKVIRKLGLKPRPSRAALIS